MTEREAIVGLTVPEETEREVSQTLPYQTKYLCVEGRMAAIFFWVAIGIAVCTMHSAVKLYAELKNNGSAEGLFFMNGRLRVICKSIEEPFSVIFLRSDGFL